jgi:hypothetical protein
MPQNLFVIDLILNEWFVPHPTHPPSKSRTATHSLSLSFPIQYKNTNEVLGLSEGFSSINIRTNAKVIVK